MQIFGSLGWLLGYILWGAYFIFKNFGLAIIVFTIIVKVALFPFTLKQQKSMAGSARMAKKQKELREKYANNRQKLQEEMNKLYEKEGVKPMGGCMTTLIPMLVLFGIFYAVAYPLTNTLHLDGQKVNDAMNFVKTIPGCTSINSGISTYKEVMLLKVFPNIQGTDIIQSLFTSDEISRILNFGNGFNIFGAVDLLVVPSQYGFWSPYILFPVFCFLSNVGSSFIMQKINSNNQMMQQGGCMKVMIFGLPLFSAYIAFSVPAAMSFYWIISALTSLLQSIVMNKVFSPAHLTATAEARHAALMFEKEAKVPYVYAPRETVGDNTNASKKKKKK